MGKNRYNLNRKHKAKPSIAAHVACVGGKREIALYKFFKDLAPAFGSARDAAAAFGRAVRYCKTDKAGARIMLSPESLSKAIGIEPVQGGLILRAMEMLGLLKAA